MKEYRYKSIMQKLSVKGSILGLTTMERLLEVLDHPEKNLKIVHTAGTNGKGSTLAFLAEILVESGYRVGRYISPTIQCYEERFQINHDFIKEEQLEKYFLKIEEASRKMEEKGWDSPTIFEAETAISLLYAKEESVDYLLLEVGMGGLLDATNAIKKTTLSIICSISEDHKGFLGDTIEKIARQKAGIIKEKTPVVLAINSDTVRNVVEETCKEKQAPFYEVREEEITNRQESAIGNTFSYKGELYQIALAGGHQIDNATTALLAANCLHAMGAYKINLESMKNGLKKTRWPGRLELLKENPPLYLDGAHNPDGAIKLAHFLQKHFTNKKIVYIMGVLGDKEYQKMLATLMPLAKEAYVFTPNNARGLQAHLLAQAMEIYDCPVHVYDRVGQALHAALEEGQDVDCYVLCGSLSFIEEMRAEFQF